MAPTKPKADDEKKKEKTPKQEACGQVGEERVMNEMLQLRSLQWDGQLD